MEVILSERRRSLCSFLIILLIFLFFYPHTPHPRLEVVVRILLGSFSKASHAKNLCNKLIDRGYNAYIQKIEAKGKKIFRVRAERLDSRSDALQLEKKLSFEDCPTKIVP